MSDLLPLRIAAVVGLALATWALVIGAAMLIVRVL